jgi:hypothetical protein
MAHQSPNHSAPTKSSILRKVIKTEKAYHADLISEGRTVYPFMVKRLEDWQNQLRTLTAVR